MFPETSVSASPAAQPLALELWTNQSVRDSAEPAAGQSQQRRADAGRLLLFWSDSDWQRYDAVSHSRSDDSLGQGTLRCCWQVSVSVQVEGKLEVLVQQLSDWLKVADSVSTQLCCCVGCVLLQRHCKSSQFQSFRQDSQQPMNICSSCLLLQRWQDERNIFIFSASPSIFTGFIRISTNIGVIAVWVKWIQTITF